MSTTTTPDLAGLRLVVEAVRRAPEEGFSMGTWECGTAACAIGWFCRAIPLDSLKMDDRFGDGDIFPVMQGTAWWGLEAVSDRFELTLRDATDLFSASEENIERTRRQIIARIEQFIAEHETS